MRKALADFVVSYPAGRWFSILRAPDPVRAALEIASIQHLGVLDFSTTPFTSANLLLVVSAKGCSEEHPVWLEVR